MGIDRSGARGAAVGCGRSIGRGCFGMCAGYGDGGLREVTVVLYLSVDQVFISVSKSLNRNGRKGEKSQGRQRFALRR